MNFGGKVLNMYLSVFTIEISGYDSPRTNQGPLRRTLAFWGQRLPGQYAPMKGSDGACVDQWGIYAIRQPTLRNFG